MHAVKLQPYDTAQPTPKKQLLGLAAGLLTAAFIATTGATAVAAPLNGAADNTTNAFGFYRGIVGGLFPTGGVPNGDNASGGTFRFLNDGHPCCATGSWVKDDFFSNESGLALTLRNGGSIVYDNNGI